MNSPGSATDISTTPRVNLVVVGVDGSAAARRAALWAAQTASTRGAQLLVIHAFSIQAPMITGMMVIPPFGYDNFQESAQIVLDGECAAVRQAFPALVVSARLVNGSAFASLLEAGTQALMTVVGSDGLGAFAKRMLGSVSLRLAGHAKSPVVVVRSEAEAEAEAEADADAESADVAVELGGPVVVGLDGSADSGEALGFAFQEASLRGVDLVGVRVWDDSDVVGFGRTYPLPTNLDEFKSEELRALSEQLVGWVEKYPDVGVHQHLVLGQPAAALLRECLQNNTFDAPSLLVVGCRGRGGFVGLMLGSISQAMISHAPCPVAVINRADES